MTVPARPTRQQQASALGTTALAVDLGSCTAGVWAAHQGTVSAPWSEWSTAAGTLVRRGSIVDVDGCTRTLSRLVRQYPRPVPAGGVVVACRPLLASAADQDATRRVIDAVLAPARVLFIDTVRAAAVGSGAAAGTLLVVDVGAELTEVALLEGGRVRAARRTEIGTRDLTRGATVELVSENVRRHLDDLRAGPDVAGCSRRWREECCWWATVPCTSGWPRRSPGCWACASTGPLPRAPPHCTAPGWQRCHSCATPSGPDHPSPALEIALLEAS